MASVEIDPTAVVHAEAQIGDRCRIGPKCLIGPQVVLGAGNELGHGVMMMGNCRLGSGNSVDAEAVIGAARFELASASHDCGITIGDDNEIQAGVTINRGCPPGPGITRIGNSTILMEASHVGPDCTVEDGVILGEDVYLDESVKIGPSAVVGAGTSVRGFVRIGAMASIDAELVVGKDIPPFLRYEGSPPDFMGVYKDALEDRGVPETTVEVLQEAFELMFRSGLSWREALAEMRTWKSNLLLFREFRAFCETIPP